MSSSDRVRMTEEMRFAAVLQPREAVVVGYAVASVISALGLGSP